MNKTILGITALAIGTGIVFATVPNTLAYRGDPTVTGPNYSEDRHEAMEKAFENKDFSAWSNLMQGKGRVIEVVNKDNFEKFATAHNLAKAGKMEDAKKIRAELGLGLRMGR